MDSAYTPFADELPRSVSSASSGWIAGILICALIALVAAFSIYRQTPPDAVPAGAPLAAFSSARAMQRLEMIAQKPHPMGSAEHARVRDYIVNQ